MKLRPQHVHRTRLPVLGWLMTGLVISGCVFATVTELLPSLRNRWGLLLFVPFAVVFTLGWWWVFDIHPKELAKKLGESKEERRRRQDAILGRPQRPH